MSGRDSAYLVKRVLLGGSSLAGAFLSLRIAVSPSSETVSQGWQVCSFRRK